MKWIDDAFAAGFLLATVAGLFVGALFACDHLTNYGKGTARLLSPWVK